MDAIAEDAETGRAVVVSIPDSRYEELAFLAQNRVSDKRLESFIDNLTLSADTKALLASLMKKAVRVGDLVIRVGKRIVEIAFMLVEKYPNTTFGLVLGLLVGALVAAVPILGALFGAFLLPLGAAFGLVHGYSEDMKDLNLKRKIAEAAAMFDPLRGTTHEAG